MPYSHVETEDLTLRDLLAVDRTIAANERTLLGYLRTSLALVATGGSLLHFVDETWALATGLALIASGVPLLGFGMSSYLRRRRALLPLMNRKRSE